MEAGAWRPETFGHTGSAICYLHHLIIFVLHPNTHNTALITPHWLEIPVIRVAGIFRCFGPFAHGNVEAEEPNEDDSVELHISTYDRLDHLQAMYNAKHNRFMLNNQLLFYFTKYTR